MFEKPRSHAGNARRDIAGSPSQNRFISTHLSPSEVLLCLQFLECSTIALLVTTSHILAIKGISSEKVCKITGDFHFSGEWAKVKPEILPGIISITSTPLKPAVGRLAFCLVGRGAEFTLADDIMSLKMYSGDPFMPGRTALDGLIQCMSMAGEQMATIDPLKNQAWNRANWQVFTHCLYAVADCVYQLPGNRQQVPREGK